jgi:Ca2+/H+ antiporter
LNCFPIFPSPLLPILPLFTLLTVCVCVCVCVYVFKAHAPQRMKGALAFKSSFQESRNEIQPDPPPQGRTSNNSLLSSISIFLAAILCISLFFYFAATCFV